jgi:hypothetical protein
MFNLGTVQHFYVVFEMFAVAYAFLPWLFFSAFQYFMTGKRCWFVWLAVIGILSSPMAYASTLWFASMAGLGLFLLGLALVKRKIGMETNRCGGWSFINRQYLLVVAQPLLSYR